MNLPIVTRDVVLDHVSGAYGGLVLHLDNNKHINIEWTPTFEPALSKTIIRCTNTTTNLRTVCLLWSGTDGAVSRTRRVPKSLSASLTRSTPR